MAAGQSGPDPSIDFLWLASPTIGRPNAAVVKRGDGIVLVAVKEIEPGGAVTLGERRVVDEADAYWCPE